MIVVTAHAIDRYIERIARVDRATAHAAIAAAERAVEAAAAFGAHVVKTAEAKLILQVHEVALAGGGMAREARIVTVIPRWQIDHSDLNLTQRGRRYAEHHGCRQ